MPAHLPVIDVTATLCCPPLGAVTTHPDRDAEEIAARLRALADAGRVRIVQDLARCEGHELTTRAAAALLGVTDATANHHLKQLEKAGIVTARREGVKVYYGLQLDAMRTIADALNVRCGAACACT